MNQKKGRKPPQTTLSNCQIVSGHISRQGKLINNDLFVFQIKKKNIFLRTNAIKHIEYQLPSIIKLSEINLKKMLLP